MSQISFSNHFSHFSASPSIIKPVQSQSGYFWSFAWFFFKPDSLSFIVWVIQYKYNFLFIVDLCRIYCFGLPITQFPFLENQINFEKSNTTYMHMNKYHADHELCSIQNRFLLKTYLFKRARLIGKTISARNNQHFGFLLFWVGTFWMKKLVCSPKESK